MQVEDIQGNIYPGFGRCIYCNSDGGNDGLRDEHIIPFSLGGNTIIEEGSCRNCEAITSRLDGYLARRTFYELRIHQTRRPKERPTHLSATLQVAGELETRMFPAKEHPSLSHYRYGTSRGIIPSRAFTTDFPSEGKMFFTYVPPSLQTEMPMGQMIIDGSSNTAVLLVR